MENRVTGGCACGAIRYTTAEKPEFSIICQCRQCQRITGAGHAASFAALANVTELTGNVTYYAQKSDSGNSVQCGFCGTCGSPILKKTSGMPQFIFFHAATLDDPSLFKPEMVVYSDTAQPWDHVDPAIERR